jgi:hypothetical protein
MHGWCHTTARKITLIRGWDYADPGGIPSRGLRSVNKNIPGPALALAQHLWFGLVGAVRYPPPALLPRSSFAPRPRISGCDREWARRCEGEAGKAGRWACHPSCAHVPGPGGEDDDVPATLSESASYEWYYCVVVLADS